MHTPSASLKAIAVAGADKGLGVVRVGSGTKAVVEGEAMVDFHRCQTVNEVETVVAVAPGTTVAKHIPHERRVAKVAAEAVDIAAIGALGEIVVIVVGKVDEQCS